MMDLNLNLIDTLVVAILSGVISGLIAYGGMRVRFDWHASDIKRANKIADEAHNIANTALITANTALAIINRRI